MSPTDNTKPLSQKPLGYILAGFIFLASAPVKAQLTFDGGVDSCIKKWSDGASAAFSSYDKIVSFCGCFVYELSSTTSPTQAQIINNYMMQTGRIHPYVQQLSDQAIFKCKKHTKLK
jgi:hypothetical protein